MSAVQLSPTLAGGPVDDEGVGTAAYESVGQLLSPVEIEFEVGVERGDHGRNHAAEARIALELHGSISLNKRRGRRGAQTLSHYAIDGPQVKRERS